MCNHAVEIVAKTMRIVGGRSFTKGNKLERLFRDVQCAAFNPPQDDLIIEQLATFLLSNGVKEEINV
ncbi:acyl-CoA dehydrogenase family protein [Psychrobacillus soli]|nr:acyl-CoA dehydrogenase family protein [Psychrobacillus soli]